MLKKCSIIVVISILFLVACSKSTEQIPVIKIYTTQGDIEVELYATKAPKTVAAFLKNIKNVTYANSNFYRVVLQQGLIATMNEGIIQGGIFYSNTTLATSKMGVPHEGTNTTGLTHDDGTISMARTELGTATTEFFICIGNQSQYDYGYDGTPDKQGYAAFGKVIKGMDAVKAILKMDSNGNTFIKKISITAIEKI
jgi:peptidyl-prolyl cis-trans isomerase A (cyclophilin A)